MPSSAETKEQDVQTDDWMQEKCFNTNESWEHLMHVLVEQSSKLVAECESLEKQLAAEESEHTNRIEGLKKMKDDKQRQHRAILDKIESVRVKLDLNSSKTTRKNFATKVEELSAERDQKLETKRRLTQEMEEANGRLKALAEEQSNERISWEQEISTLQHELESLSSQVEESNQTAVRDEIAALESQRELVISQGEDWIAEAERYLNTLRSDPSPQSFRLRQDWEKNVAMVRNSLGKQQLLYNDNVKKLHKGQQLDSLPKILLPHLPLIPMIDLLNFTSFTPIRPAVTQSQFHSAHRTTSPLLPAQNPAAFPPHKLEQSVAVPRLAMPTTICAPAAPQTRPAFTLPYAAAVPRAQGSPINPAAAPGLQGAGPMATVRNPASQALPSNPQPAGQLAKLLERLSTQFPQCTRSQIVTVLQQVKSERGTVAGMSIEEIKQQVEQKLAQNQRPPPGPIAPPAGSRHSQRGPVQPALSTRPSVHIPSAHVFQSRGPQTAPSVRKLCLMCQNIVEPGTQYHTNCPHTLHKECISVWLQSSKNNSCPFCPSK